MNQHDPRDWLNYHPEQGIFTVKAIRRQQQKQSIGDECGSIVDGRYQIKTGGKKYSRARLAWFFAYGIFPDGVIKHKNGNVLDDRIENLEETTRIERIRSVATNKRNSTGFSGVSFHKKSGKYSAQITVNGKSMYLGLFDDPSEASKTAMLTKEVMHEN